jgi:acyl-CoA thioesterase-2
MQADRLILSLAASLHDEEVGPTQQAEMPDVPPPEALISQDDVIREAMPYLPAHRHPFWDRDLGLEFRSVEPFVTFEPPHAPARRHFWMKVKLPLGDDPALHQQMLAYMSDLYLMHTGLGPLGIGWADAHLQDASLDHAIWFHQRFRADEWLLYAMDSPYAGGARTLGRGTVFTRDGRVVASVAQEGLIRVPPAQAI